MNEKQITSYLIKSFYSPNGLGNDNVLYFKINLNYTFKKIAQTLSFIEFFFDFLLDLIVLVTFLIILIHKQHKLTTHLNDMSKLDIMLTKTWQMTLHYISVTSSCTIQKEKNCWPDWPTDCSCWDTFQICEKYIYYKSFFDKSNYLKLWVFVQLDYGLFVCYF